MFGPDTVASLLPDQLVQLCKARDAVHVMLSSAVDKNAIASSLQGTGKLFSRSLALKSPQIAGTIIEKGMITLKKPGTGLPESMLSHCVGRRLARNVPADRLLQQEDFER